MGFGAVSFEKGISEEEEGDGQLMIRMQDYGRACHMECSP
jgi:hypothetical protein